MIDRDALKKKYQSLTTPEKVQLGEALVKVNVGVGSPEELRRVAAFLKGSEFIAKPDALDDLISSLHEDDKGASPSKTSPDKTSTVVQDFPSDSLIEDLVDHDEDKEVTSKEKFKK